MLNMLTIAILQFGVWQMQSASWDHASLSVQKFIEQELQYPELAREYAIEGIVKAIMSIDEYGKVTKVEITQSLHSSCDREAERILMQLPRAEPAKLNKVAVPSQVPIAIQFSLR